MQVSKTVDSLGLAQSLLKIIRQREDCRASIHSLGLRAHDHDSSL